MRPSAGIGVVEVQKLEVSCVSCGADPLWFLFLRFLRCRAAFCGDRRGRGAKLEFLFTFFCGARATLCGDRRGRGAKTGGFLRFLTFPDEHLCGDRACRSALAVALCEFFLVSDEPSAEIVRFKALWSWRRACCSRNGLWKLSHGFSLSLERFSKWILFYLRGFWHWSVQEMTLSCEGFEV